MSNNLLYHEPRMRWKEQALALTPADADLYFVPNVTELTPLGETHCKLVVPDGFEAYYIDLEPNANLAHDHRYLVFAPNGGVFTAEADMPPTVPHPEDELSEDFFVYREPPELLNLDDLWRRAHKNHLTPEAKVWWVPWRNIPFERSEPGKPKELHKPEGGSCYFIDPTPQVRWYPGCRQGWPHPVYFYIFDNDFMRTLTIHERNQPIWPSMQLQCLQVKRPGGI